MMRFTGLLRYVVMVEISGFSHLRNRLMIIAYEDIGIGNPEVVLQVSIALRDMKKNVQQ